MISIIKLPSDLSPFCFRGEFSSNSKIENKQSNNLSCITTENHSTKTTGRRLCMSSPRSGILRTVVISNSSFPFSKKKRQLSSRIIAQGNACLVAKFYI